MFCCTTLCTSRTCNCIAVLSCTICAPASLCTSCTDAPMYLLFAMYLKYLHQLSHLVLYQLYPGYICVPAVVPSYLMYPWLSLWCTVLARYCCTSLCTSRTPECTYVPVNILLYCLRTSCTLGCFCTTRRDVPAVPVVLMHWLRLLYPLYLL